jgi:hypothetical protein
MEKAFLGFFRFDIVIAQVLHIAVLLVLIIPFETIPIVCSHYHS